MPRFARLLGEGMRDRGHDVSYATSPHFFGRLPLRSRGARKWLGYVDQFLVFPSRLRKMARGKKALFVVTDQALGMWLPALGRSRHVVHCHDFLAQRSALGEFPENPTGWSGRQYQALIRDGYRRARNFISVSQKTQADLRFFLKRPPHRDEVVYNPLNYPFCPMEKEQALARLSGRLPFDPAAGFVLHVGGNQWYKNREGVVRLYQEYCRRSANVLPLLMAGAPPNEELRVKAENGAEKGRIAFLGDLTDEEIHAAYATARVLLFPSLEEGFGWPIAEAHACGCPVLTTDAAPMNEVGADAAFYIPRRPANDDSDWMRHGADRLQSILDLPGTDRELVVRNGLRNAERFRPEDALNRIERIYQEIYSSASEPEADIPAVRSHGY